MITLCSNFVAQLSETFLTLSVGKFYVDWAFSEICITFAINTILMTRIARWKRSLAPPCSASHLSDLPLASLAGWELRREGAEQPRLSVIKTGGRSLQIVALGRQFEVSFHL